MIVLQGMVVVAAIYESHGYALDAYEYLPWLLCLIAQAWSYQLT
jgi:hypothetical protein